MFFPAAGLQPQGLAHRKAALCGPEPPLLPHGRGLVPRCGRRGHGVVVTSLGPREETPLLPPAPELLLWVWGTGYSRSGPVVETGNCVINGKHSRLAACETPVCLLGARKVLERPVSSALEYTAGPKLVAELRWIEEVLGLELGGPPEVGAVARPTGPAHFCCVLWARLPILRGEI